MSRMDKLRSHRRLTVDPLFGVCEIANLRPANIDTGTGTSPSGSTGGAGGSAGLAGQASSAAGAGTAGVGNILPWLYPTADFRNFDKGPSPTGNNGNPTGVVALPAIGATSTILQFRIDNGRAGKITQMGIDYVANGGAAYTQGILPAQLTFSLSADGKTIFRDYDQFQFLLGAVSAPTPINGLMLREGQVIALTVKNVSIVVTTQFLAARLLGYTFGEKFWSKLMGAQ